MFPSNVAATGTPFPPPGPRGLGSPASTVLWGAPTSCLPDAALRCLRLALPDAASCRFAPAVQDARPGPGVLRRAPLPAICVWRWSGPPRFLGDPRASLPCSPTPAGPTRLAYGTSSARPPLCPRRRLLRLRTFGALSHGFQARCLRFALGLLLRTQDSLPAAGRSTGRDWLPAGFPRKVSRCILHRFPLSQAFPGARTGSAPQRPEQDTNRGRAVPVPIFECPPRSSRFPAFALPLRRKRVQAPAWAARRILSLPARGRSQSPFSPQPPLFSWNLLLQHRTRVSDHQG